MHSDSPRTRLRTSRPCGIRAAAVAILFAAGLSNAQFSLGANFWNLEWGGGYHNYFAKGIDWKTTDNPWNPQLIAELREAGITCLRYMDWSITNGSNVTTWSQRVPKTANHYNTRENHLLNFWNPPGGNGYGVAYEWMIDLCHRAGADIWVCIPAKAAPDFSLRLAILIRHGVDMRNVDLSAMDADLSGKTQADFIAAGGVKTCEPLAPHLKLYVEYSNEVWNGGFPQFSWVRDQPLSTPPDQLQWQGRTISKPGGFEHQASKYVLLSVRALHQFNRVWGADNKRLVRVLAGFILSHDNAPRYNFLCDWHMACTQNTTSNPHQVKIDAYAVSPYYQGCNEQAMRKDIAEHSRRIGYVRNSLKNSGVALIAYEGGPDNAHGHCAHVAHEPFQEQLIIEALNTFSAAFDGVFVWYTFNGGGLWGFKSEVGDDPSISPRWRGLLRWREANPVSAEAPSALRIAQAPRQTVWSPYMYNLQGRMLRSTATFSVRVNTTEDRMVRRIIIDGRN